MCVNPHVLAKIKSVALECSTLSIKIGNIFVASYIERRC